MGNSKNSRPKTKIAWVAMLRNGVRSITCSAPCARHNGTGRR
jgi:hypothetical protein